MTALSWQIVILAATVWAEGFLWMAWAARRDLRRERQRHRLLCAGRLEAANRVRL